MMETKQRIESRSKGNGFKMLFTAALIALIFFLSFFGIIWKIGYFSFTGSESSAKIVASAITLLGTLFGTLITFFGLFLKHSIDQRNIALREQTETRERIESERNIRLAEEAERRLKVETAIQAIGLLSSSGQDVPNTQRAGVILTLADLGMLELSMSLVDQMLYESKIDSNTFGWLLNKAISSGVLDVQREATLLMGSHLSKMLIENGEAECPPILLSEAFFLLPEEIRINGVFCLVDLITLRSYTQWKPGTFYTVVNFIFQIWEKDKSEHVKVIAGTASAEFLKVYKAYSQINLGSSPREIKEVIKSLSVYRPSHLWGTHPNGLERSQALSEWANALEDSEAS